MSLVRYPEPRALAGPFPTARVVTPLAYFIPAGPPFFGDTGSTISVTTQGAGDGLLVAVTSLSSTVWATGLSGGNATGWTQVGSAVSITSFATATLWYATTNATGSGTITITWNGAAPGYRAAGLEFSAAGPWSVDTFANLSSAGTTALPSLTPAVGAGELYWIFPVEQTSASAGTTAGFTFFADAHANVGAFNASCSSAAQSPALGAESGSILGIAVLLKPGAGGTNVTAGVPSGTGAASQPVVSASVLAGIPAAAGTAPQPAAGVQAIAPPAVATGAAPGPVASPAALPGIAAATGTASQPVTSVQVLAGAPTATGTAPQATPSIAVLPGAPTATGAAPAPSIQTTGATNINAPAVTATGTASQPVVAITVFPGIPTATGTAPAPVPGGSVLAGLASAAGAAPAPVPSISAKPGIPAATGTAPAPSIFIGQIVNAPAAAVTGTAPVPALAASVFAGIPAGTGAAPAPARGVGATAPAATGNVAQPVERISALPSAAAATGAVGTATPVTVLPFTVGTLTAFDAPVAVLAGATVSGGSGGVLTASDTRAGGPSG